MLLQQSTNYESQNLRTNVLGSYSEGDNITFSSGNTIEFDVPDKYHHFDMKFRLYDKDGTIYNAEDDHFDISNDGSNPDITYHTTSDTWEGETTTGYTQGTDAEVWFDVDTGHIGKVHTLLFPGANDTMNYNATMGTETGNEQVFICFAGHGNDKKYDSNTQGQFDITPTDMGKVGVYWKDIAKALDDNTIDLTGHPNYGKMIILVYSCHSGYALEPFSEKDAQKRIVITSAGKDELSFERGGHLVFLYHFINFLEGDYESEYSYTFQQLFLWAIVFGIVVGLLQSALVVLILSLTGPLVALMLVVGIIVTLIVACMIASFIASGAQEETIIYGGEGASIYDAYKHAKKYSRLGCGFQFVDGELMGTRSHADIANKPLAKETYL